MEDRNSEEIMEIIRSITDRGNDAEVRKDKNGKLKVFEVKKKAAI